MIPQLARINKPLSGFSEPLARAASGVYAVRPPMSGGANRERQSPDMQRGLLATGDEIRDASNKLRRNPFSRIYERLLAKCSLILHSAPIMEQQWRRAWQTGRWGAALVAARIAQGRLWDLLIAHHLDANRAFRDRAVEELKQLTRWSTWTDPCNAEMPADLCTAEAVMAAAVALDWLADDLTEADRKGVADAIRAKALEPYCRAVDEKVWWYSCYHNWNAALNCGCGLAGLLLADEDPIAREACDKAKAGLKRFFNALGREGGWDEGIGYWGYAMRFVLLFGEALSRVEDDRHIFHERGMDATGLFGPYFSPNGQPANFGDNATVPLYGGLYLFAKHYGLREIAWWLDAYGYSGDVSTTDVSSAGLALLFRPADIEERPEPALEPLKVYEQVGWAALADAWPTPGLYVAVKTGDLAAHHAHHDMNAVQVQVDGEMLLSDTEHPPFSRAFLSEAREEFYEVQARAHNTIVVADRDHRIDARGRFVGSAVDKRHRWVACDAGEACGENVRFVRHVTMFTGQQPAERMLLVLDDLEVGVPEKVQLFWHTPGQVALEAEAGRGTITGYAGALHFALWSSMESQVWADSRTAGRGRRDRFITLAGGAMGRVLIVSAFSPGAPIESVTCEESEDGTVVKAGAVTARFARERGLLALRSFDCG